MANQPSEVRTLLARLRDKGIGEDGERLRELLYRALYDDLRSIAAALMRCERSGHTLQPTALVHEAYLRLDLEKQNAGIDRRHFLRIATRAMRQVLVDHARRSGAAKRGGGWTRVSLDEGLAADSPPTLDILELDGALERLARSSERLARVAELRILAGLPMQEIADTLEVSLRTAAGDWSFARLWLARELYGGESA